MVPRRSRRVISERGEAVRGVTRAQRKITTVSIKTVISMVAPPMVIASLTHVTIPDA